MIRLFSLTIAMMIQLSLFSQVQAGFFDFEISADGKVKLHVPADKLDFEFLYVNSLAAGLGSNDIGLDRGQLGGTAIVKFIKAGNKLMLIEPNQRYRAISDNELEVLAVKEAFAESVLWGFDLKDQAGPNYVIDITPFILRDAHNVSGRLKRAKEGSYKLNKDMSAIWEDRTKNFPKNSEFENILTFVGEPSGKYIRTVAPNSNHLTVRQHHSFIELPDDQYQPRAFHPYSAYGQTSYYDYATPIAEPIEKRYINRHRLIKKDPDAAISEAVEPIIYYIDAGCPDPVKTALMNGARWWDQAYQAAGFAPGTFQVRDLPAGADPLDVRYNMIQWIHRSTRGWSYGSSVRDPRTGEIIKGHVSLGSLRVRQDFMITQALLSPYEKDSQNHGRMQKLALARLNQLAAHEVGHTLGIAHNFASSYNDRASVMDYPQPLISSEGAEMNLKKAYDDKIGEWDKFTIRYGYTQYNSTEEEAAGLANLIKEAQAKGLKFISDRDARPAAGAHPNAHLWDNGADVITELDKMMTVRKAALANFGENTITKGTPLSELEKVLVPLYYYHRYQAEAVTKLIGGLDYSYTVKGDDLPHQVKPVARSTQVRAINSLLQTLSPDALKVPDHIIDLIPPAAFGYSKSRESFKSQTGMTFDPIAASESYANYILEFMLNPQRLSRMLQYHSRDSDQLSVQDYFTTIKNTVGRKGSDSYADQINQSTETIFVNHLLKLAMDSQINQQVAAQALYYINQEYGKTASNDVRSMHLAHMVKRAMANPGDYKWPEAEAMPPGSPIGCGETFFDR